MSSANDRDDRLADWLDGRLSPRDHERFEAELRVNPDLRRRAEEYRRTVESVQRALRAPMLKVDVADAVMRRIAEGGARPAPIPSATVLRGASRRALLMSGTVAAAVFALIALLFRWRPEPEQVPLTELAPRATAPTPTLGAAMPADPGSATGAGDDKVLEQFADRMKAGLRTADGEAELRSKATPSPAAPPGTGGFVGVVTPAPAAPATKDLAGDATPTKDAKLLNDLAEAVRRAEQNDVGAAAPVVPITMLPQVRLVRSLDVAHAVPQGQTPEQVAASAFFSRVDADLTTALPSGSLQIQRLARAPGLFGMKAEPADTGVEPDAQAWLVEGPGPEVYHYLSMLSGAGRSLGFELVNGEVAVNELVALQTATSAEGEKQVVEEQLRSAKESGEIAAGGGGRFRSNVESKAKARDAQPDADAPKPQVPAAPPPLRQSGEPRGNPVGRAGEADELSRAAGSAVPGPTPTPQPKPEENAVRTGSNAMMPTRMRVVIVIDRATPQKR